MDWSNSTMWWILAGVLVAVEMTTLTFYLLMLALGAAAGAVAAHVGATTTTQLLWAAAVGAGTTALWHFLRPKPGPDQAAAMNRDVNLDIGETLTVTDWQSDGTARVNYRGALWTARSAQTQTQLRKAGVHRIVAVHGSELVVEFAAEVGHIQTNNSNN